MNNNNHHIVTKNLNFYYTSRHILKNINLYFDRGKVTAIIGPSGSGKSTLIRTFNRIYELTPQTRLTGKIIYNGQSIFDKSLDVRLLRQRIGMVFQKPTPFPMSIYKNVAFGLKRSKLYPKKEISKKVKEALKQAALWDEVKHMLNSSGTYISGGQQQRLCIARTLALKPDVLLLDEPTSSLDPISTEKIETLIAQLKGKYTVIIVTHNLSQAKRVSDDTLFLINGEVVEKAPTYTFFTNPKDERTKNYIRRES